jgi:hypothetical protein
MRIESFDEALEMVKALKEWAYQEKYKEHADGSILSFETVRTAAGLCEQVLEVVALARLSDFEGTKWANHLWNILDQNSQCVSAVNKLAYRMYVRRVSEMEQGA